ncbi:phosphatidylinositol 4-kinase-like [Tribolium madens]|uniref:phosphatidylinositol 4-kinase-like n=1 Tax=Tribolium madens TaxID=41895 RepID=UPI001CF72A1C|nr:phosphatidylinositol 4-kinase-like [Tribolium madens]
MGVSRVIKTLLLIVVCCVFVVSEDVPAPSRTLPAAVSPVAAEGGPIMLPNDTTHMGREHMIKVNHNKVTPDFVVGQKSDNKTSVPKKGAVLPDSKVKSTSSSTTTTTTSTTTTTTTTTTTIPPKPTLTIGEDEEPLNEKHDINRQSVVEKHKKTDYVVPIVVVILSVPLVAIIFSVLYKRGSDWWQHRHYRRMDFLINGMYDN